MSTSGASQLASLEKGSDISLQKDSKCLYPSHELNSVDAEIEQVSEDKRKAIMPDTADREVWRESIRQQLESELTTRVEEILAAQFSLKSSNSSKISDEQPLCLKQLPDQAPPYDVLSSKMESLEKEKQDICEKTWKVSDMKRHIRKIMSESTKELLKPCYSKHHSGLLLHHLRQTNQNRLNDFLMMLNEHQEEPEKKQDHVEIHERAIYNFSALNSSERHSFFYPFTKAGFQDATRSRKLPNGKEFIEIRPGFYQDYFGIIRNKDGPFWPIDRGPMFATPFHQSGKSDHLVEPLQTAAAESSVELLEQQQLLRFPSKWRGVVVIFDSMKSPRDYMPPSASEGHCPSLVFESRFESGNLRQARRIGQFEYELVLNTDLYTKRHTQWYYFRIQNAQPKTIYTFKIINLLKKDSLYAYGMKPLLYSENLAKAQNIGWTRTGCNITYTRNTKNLHCPLLMRERNYYFLQWQMEFPSSDDTCYIAHCYPYTFTDLRNDLDNLLADVERSKVMKLDIMCETKAGNSCFLVTVTDNSSETKKSSSEKKGVIVTARVHPGETNSSWMMRGLLNFITGSSASAKVLRKHFTFHIVPMINPDGVIVGNYRCCLSGHDLNRNYRKPSKESFPTVWHIKDMIAKFSDSNPVLLYCDLHGHSRKQNVFMYGCAADYDQDFQPLTYLRGRLFPWLMAKKSPDKFSYQGCKFHIRRCKESTGRVVMYRQLNISNSFTMEATFCGSTINQGEKRHFTTRDFEEMGQVLCQVTLDYWNTQEDPMLESRVLQDMMKYLMAKFQQKDLVSANLSTFESFKNLCDKQGIRLEPLSQSGDNLQPYTLETSEQTSQSMILSDSSGSLTADSFENCLLLMKNSSIIQQLKEESDSSDSDSESEPECISLKSRSHRKKKKKNKKTRSQKSNEVKLGDTRQDITCQPNADIFHEEQLSPPQPTSLLPSINSLECRQSKNQIDSITPEQMITRNVIKSYPPFVNRYEGRSNGGIPCFSQERVMYRAAKKLAEIQKTRGEDQKYYSDYLTDRTDADHSLYYCTCHQMAGSSSVQSLISISRTVNESLKFWQEENRIGQYTLCKTCGLPQRTNITSAWNQPQYTNQADCYPFSCINEQLRNSVPQLSYSGRNLTGNSTVLKADSLQQPEDLNIRMSNNSNSLMLGKTHYHTAKKSGNKPRQSFQPEEGLCIVSSVPLLPVFKNKTECNSQ